MNEVFGRMGKRITLEDTLKHVSAELLLVNYQLRSGAAECDPSAMNEFRDALDTVRLTSWTVCELARAKGQGADPRAAQKFLATERLRRLEKMVKDLCADLDLSSAGKSENLDSLLESLAVLQSRLNGDVAAKVPAEPVIRT
ncbi:MAG TPA: hypothetical protein VFK06_15045 [Candidatus Angelobacter sp.]|nr:hypothetical protein [Candidatus Angelobacter sp.]